jgi:hypothetical protein
MVPYYVWASRLQWQSRVLFDRIRRNIAAWFQPDDVLDPAGGLYAVWSLLQDPLSVPLLRRTGRWDGLLSDLPPPASAMPALSPPSPGPPERTDVQLLV